MFDQNVQPDAINSLKRALFFAVTGYERILCACAMYLKAWTRTLKIPSRSELTFLGKSYHVILPGFVCSLFM